jgi:uncharacterized protein
VHLPLWQGILLVVVGCLAGFLNVMAGGGSLITMPVMVFLGMSGPEANGTNRVALLAQNIAAVAGFLRHGRSEFRRSLTLSLCCLPGAIAGAYYGTKLEGVLFNRVLAVVMVGVMILMSTKPKKARAEAGQATRRQLLAGHLLMIGAGFYGGFIQAGVGFILMAILGKVLCLDLVRVNMHKVFIVATYTIASLAVFSLGGKVLWGPGLFLMAGNAAGGWLASHVAVRKGERVIRWILNLCLGGLAVKLLLG